MDSLRTFFLGRELSSPLVLPAGILGMSASSLIRCSSLGAGLVTTKTYTLEPRAGHPLPVTAEYEAGLLNAMGLPNPGLSEGLREVAEYLSRTQAHLILSVFATQADEFIALARMVQSGLPADHAARILLELNLSCPNVSDEFGTPLAASPALVGRIVAGVKEAVRLPIIAKLSPNVADIRPMALAAARAGADALSLINSLGPGLLIDIVFRRPLLSNIYGGISGAAVKPLALRFVYQSRSVVSIPIIGMGGVGTSEDAVAMLMAGADLVGVGSAVRDKGISVFAEINEGLAAWMKDQGLESTADMPRLEHSHV